MLFSSRRIIVASSLLVLGLSRMPAQDPASVKEVAVTYRGHKETVYAVSVSPDGKQLLTGSFDKTVKLWDLASGKELRTFGGAAGHQNIVLAVAFSPDGQTFASGGSDNLVKVWDVPASRARHELALSASVTATAISSDGKTAAAGDTGGEIKVVNPADGKELLKLKGHVGAVTGLAFAPNNPKSLASVGVDGTLRLWDLNNGKPVATIIAHEKPIRNVAFATGGNLVFTAGDDGAVKYWQLPIAPAKPLAGHADTVRALAMSPDGNFIATGSTDKNVRLFGPDGGNAIRTLPANQAVTAVATAGINGNAITVAGTSTGQILIWGGDGKLIFQVTAHTGPVTGLALSPSGTQFASAGADGILLLWSLPIVPTKTIPQPADVRSAVVSLDGKHVTTINADNQLRLWNATNSQAEKTLGVNATVLAQSNDGSAFAIAGPDNIIRYQKRDAAQPLTLPNQPGVVSLAIHPNGTQLLAAYSDGNMKLWPLPFPPKDPKPVWESKLPGVRKVIYEPKGNQFLSIAADKAIHIGDAKTGKELKKLAVQDAGLTDICINGDGTRVATSSEANHLKLWSMTDGLELYRINFPAAPTRIALSGNGDRVAVSYAKDGKFAVTVCEAKIGVKAITLDDRYANVASLNFDPASRALIVAADKSVTITDIPFSAFIIAHLSGVTGVAYAPNNDLFTCGNDANLKVWNSNTGQMTRGFPPLPDTPTALALSRDGALVAAALGKQVKVWNSGDAKELQTLVHPAGVIALGFSPDHTRLVTGATDNLARVWDLAKGQELQAFSHGAAVHGVAFPLSRPNTIVTASADKTAVVHTINNARFVAASPSPIRCLTATPNGAHLLVAGDDKSVQLLNLNSGTIERRFLGATGPVFATAISRNNNLVAAAGADKLVRLYTFNDGNLVGQFATPNAVHSLSFNQTGTAIASSGDGKSATLWNIAYQPGNPLPPEFGTPIQSFDHPSPVPVATMSIDGTMLVSGCDDKLARMWRVAAEGPVRNFPHPNLVDSVAYNKESTLLATGCHDGVVRIYDLAKGGLLRQINAHAQPQPSAVYSVAWSPDSKQIASGSFDRSIKIWDATNGNLVREIKGHDPKTAPKGHSDGVFTVAWSPDGKQIASGSSDRMIKLWNAADGNLIRDFINPNLPSSSNQPATSHPGWVYHLRYTASGQLVSVGGAPRNHGYVALWNPADGKLLYGADLPLGPFYDCCPTPDGAQVVIACGPLSRQNPDADAVLIKLR
jgi:WD40 repeat protein